MFRRDTKARFTEGASIAGVRLNDRIFDSNSPDRCTKYYDEEPYKHMMKSQKDNPVALCRRHKKTWWMFQDEFYVEDEGYTQQEVKALALEMTRKKERKVQKAISYMAREEAISGARRERIPDDVKMFVWQRDGGKCVRCGSQQNLEFDHIIPVARGGSNTARNIQLLCESCNRAKGENLV